MNKLGTGVPWLKVTCHGERWVVFDKDKEPGLFMTGPPKCVLFQADTFDECCAWIDDRRSEEEQAVPDAGPPVL